MTKEDIDNEYYNRSENDNRKYIESNFEVINAFIDYAKGFNVYLNTDNFSYKIAIGIILDYKGIVDILCPDLVVDKEGLVSWRDLNQLYTKWHTGYFKTTNFALMAHYFFRRSFSQYANYYPRFIQIFWDLEFDDSEVYIALDRDRLRINLDNRFYEEHDTWYGASFSKDINNIPDTLVKLRPPSDVNEHDIDFFFHKIYSLDVLWKTKESIKEIQLEEFHNDKVFLTNNNILYYPVRYIHAEYDCDKGWFRHFDGAIHLYTKEEYYIRRDSDFNHVFKTSKMIKCRSEKVFKINGKISIEKWILLTSQFMSGNPLINEYFEGQLPERLRENLDKIKKI